MFNRRAGWPFDAFDFGEAIVTVNDGGHSGGGNIWGLANQSATLELDESKRDRSIAHAPYAHNYNSMGGKLD